MIIFLSCLPPSFSSSHAKSFLSEQKRFFHDFLIVSYKDSGAKRYFLFLTPGSYKGKNFLPNAGSFFSYLFRPCNPSLPGTDLPRYHPVSYADMAYGICSISGASAMPYIFINPSFQLTPGNVISYTVLPHGIPYRHKTFKDAAPVRNSVDPGT